MDRQVPQGIAGKNALQSIWAAMQTYVSTHGGKIDKIQVNGVDQTISPDKTVNIAVQKTVVQNGTPSGLAVGDFWYQVT